MGGLGDRSGKFSLVSGGDDDLCKDKDLNNRRGQVKRSGSHGSVNIEGNFLYQGGVGVAHQK